MKSIVRFKKIRKITYGEKKDKVFYLAEVDENGHPWSVAIDEEDLDYYEKGKSYPMSLTINYKGSLTLVLGLEVTAAPETV